MGCFSSPSPPPPPDYAGAAEATAAGDLEAARYQTLANRPNSYYPGGSREWVQGTGSVFDQAGYDQALADYYAAGVQAPSISGAAPATGYIPGVGGYESQGVSLVPDPGVGWYGGNYENSTNQQAGPSGDPGAYPMREDYTTLENPDQWSEYVRLSPEGQRAFDINERNTTGLATLASQGINQMQGIFDTPFQISGQASNARGATGDMPQFQGPGGDVPGYEGYRQNVVDAMLARSDKDISRDREAKRSELISRGIPEGSEAFNNEMNLMNRKQTDARQQAEIAAEQMAGMGYGQTLAGRQQMGKEAMDRFGTGMDVRNQYNQEGLQNWQTGMDTRRQNIQEALLERQTPINEMSAFRTGSQVGTPQFQPFGQQQFTGGPNYSGAAAAQGQYGLGAHNADVAQNNTMWGGLFDIGAAGIKAYPWSDRRLKTKIKRLGTSLMGLPIYSFNYIWGGYRQIGVMAQDVLKVKPEAVIHRDGYMAVNYGLIR